jgi:four helix bundle protein
MRNDLKERTQKFALFVIHLVEKLPRNQPAVIIGKQLIRSGTSVGANYRAACRARSRADFISKMGIVEEELDECMYWLEILAKANIVSSSCIHNAYKEADELLSIIVRSIKTAKENK